MEHFTVNTPSLQQAKSNHSYHPVRLKALSLSWLLATAVTTATLPINTLAAEATQPAAEKTYDIPASDLTDALTEFFLQAKIPLAFTPETFSGMQSAGLKGRYSVDEALAKLLENTGYQAHKDSNNAYSISKHANGVTINLKVDASSINDTTEINHSYIVDAVSIGKMGESLIEIPHSVSVITQQQIEDQNLTTVDAALRQAAGVTAYKHGGEASGFTARGYGLNAMYDGIAANSGLVKSPQFDLALYDHIEVLRGPMGLLQGVSNPSGSVNFVRKRPAKAYQASLSATSSSDETYHTDLDVSAPLDAHGKIRARGVLAAEDQTNSDDIQYQRHYMGYAIIEADLTPHTTAAFSLALQDKKLQRNMGLPTRASTGEIIGSPASYFGAKDGYAKFPMHEITAELDHKFTDSGWQGHLSLRRKEVEYDYLYGYISSAVADDNTASVRLQRSYIYEENTGLDAYASGPFSLLGRKHEALLGYNMDYFETKYGSNGTTLTNQSIYNTQYDLSQTGPLPEDLWYDKLKQSGYYGKIKFSLLDPLTLTLGARYSKYQYKWSKEGSTVWQDYSGVADGEITPYAGLVFEVTDAQALYASYSDIFKPQSRRKDANGKPLDPNIGKQYEAGLKSEWLDGQLNTTASVYRIEDENQAMEDLTSVCATTCYVTSGKQRSQGFEIEAIGQPSERWDLSASYTYNDNKYLVNNNSSVVGKQFATDTPRHLAKLWTNYKLSGNLHRVSLGGGLKYQSDISRNIGNHTLHQGGYTVWDGQIGYQLTPSASLTFTVNNLLDKRYFDRITAAGYYNYYGDPRTWTLTLRSTL